MVYLEIVKQSLKQKGSVVYLEIRKYSLNRGGLWFTWIFGNYKTLFKQE